MSNTNQLAACRDNHPTIPAAWLKALQTTPELSITLTPGQYRYEGAFDTALTVPQWQALYQRLQAAPDWTQRYHSSYYQTAFGDEQLRTNEKGQSKALRVAVYDSRTSGATVGECRLSLVASATDAVCEYRPALAAVAASAVSGGDRRWHLQLTRQTTIPLSATTLGATYRPSIDIAPAVHLHKFVFARTHQQFIIKVILEASVPHSHTPPLSKETLLTLTGNNPPYLRAMLTIESAVDAVASARCAGQTAASDSLQVQTASIANDRLQSRLESVAEAVSDDRASDNFITPYFELLTIG